MNDPRQTDIADVIGALQRGPILSTHQARVRAIMEHFASAGLTLATCADARHLNRSLSTLKRYAREQGLQFPDYVPMALRPPKLPEAKKP